MSAIPIGESSDEVVAPDEFMNCKKAHEVKAMSEVVASLAKCCRVKQVKCLKCNLVKNKLNLVFLIICFCFSGDRRGFRERLPVLVSVHAV